MRGLAVDGARDQPDRADKNQRLPGKAVIEINKPLRGRDTRTVPARLNPGHNSVQNLRGRKHGIMAVRIARITRIFPRVGKAEPVAVNHRLRAKPESHAIAVHADNPGNRPAERIKRGRGVMRLHLIADQVILIENNAPRIIGKDRHADIVFAALLADFLCCSLDIMAVETVLHIIDRRGENRMLAMFRPCLRKGFQFNILGVPALFFEIIADRLQVKKGKPKGPAPRSVRIGDSLFPDCLQLGFADRKIDLIGNNAFIVQMHFRHHGTHAAVTLILRSAFDGGSLNEAV